MKIVRDGKEIELTPQELVDAYMEQQELFDIADVRTLLECFDDEELQISYGGTFAQLEPLIEEMATRMRRYIDKYDMNWDYAREEAVLDIAEENLHG